MFPLADVVDLFAYELAGLCRGRRTFLFVAARAFDRLSFWHWTLLVRSGRRRVTLHLLELGPYLGQLRPLPFVHDVFALAFAAGDLVLARVNVALRFAHLL